MILTHFEPVEEGYEGKKIILTDNKDLIADGVQAIDDEFLEWFIENPSCEEVEIDCRLTIKENGIQELMKDEYYQKFPEELPNCVFINHYKIIIPKEEPKPIHQQIIDIVGGEERFREIAKIKPIHPKVFSEKGNELFFDEKGYLIKEELERGTIVDALKQVIDDKLKQETIDDFIKEYQKDKTYWTINEKDNEAINMKIGAKWQQEQLYSKEEVEIIANELVNWAINNIGNPNPQSGKKFDEVITKFKKK